MFQKEKPGDEPGWLLLAAASDDLQPLDQFISLKAPSSAIQWVSMAQQVISSHAPVTSPTLRSP
jgi:hypothetical protein